MQVSINAHDNFVNSINSAETKEQYEYCLTQFLKYCQLNLDAFLKLPQDEISSLIVNYLLQRRFAEMKITDIKIPTDRVLMDVDHSIIDTVKIASAIIGVAEWPLQFPSSFPGRKS